MALIQSAGTAQLAGVGSTSVILSTNMTTGNFIAVGVNISNTSILGSVSSITDNQGNTYVSAAIATRSTLLDFMDTELWYAANITGGAGTITVNHTVDNCAIYVREYSGVSTISPLDIAGSANGSTTTPNSGTVNSAFANDLIIIATGDSLGSTQTWTAAGAYGNIAGTASILTGMSMEDKTVSGTAAQTGTVSLGGAANWTSLLGAFKLITVNLSNGGRNLLGVGL